MFIFLVEKWFVLILVKKLVVFSINRWIFFLIKKGYIFWLYGFDLYFISGYSFSVQTLYIALNMILIYLDEFCCEEKRTFTGPS